MLLLMLELYKKTNVEYHKINELTEISKQNLELTKEIQIHKNMYLNKLNSEECSSW